MPLRKKARCSRCERRMFRDELIDWLDEAGGLSPRFCPRCYAYILDNWEEGMDVSDMPQD